MRGRREWNREAPQLQKRRDFLPSKRRIKKPICSHKKRGLHEENVAIPLSQVKIDEFLHCHFALSFTSYLSYLQRLPFRDSLNMQRQVVLGLEIGIGPQLVPW